MVARRAADCGAEARAERATAAPPGSLGAPASNIRDRSGQASPPKARQITGCTLHVPRRAWSASIFCEIANFQLFRRQYGVVDADAVLAMACEQVVERIAGARVVVASRSSLEIMFEASDFDACLAIMKRVRDVIGEIGFAMPTAPTLEIVIGGAAVSGIDHDEVRLVEAAEAALELARAERRDILSNVSVDGGGIDVLMLMRELPSAILSGQMTLHYQPKVHIRRQEVASVEALVRWQHPERGLILPGDFIAIAERSGAIDALTRWTLRQAIADQRILASDGHIMTVFLNISGMLLADRAFIDEACRLIIGSGAKIGFEITETAVIREPEKAIAHLEMLSRLGVPIAIDDYGAGLSSLAYLKKLPAGELKIDKGFVLQLTSSNRDPLIVRSTIDLAHALDMEVTAEGVETPAALALLSVMGCDMVQGYLLGKPTSLDVFRNYLAEERHLGAVANGRPTFHRPEAFWKRA
ncbi:conserved hypothetical protein [Sphingomonas sp. AX6]|nr:conserved hypothetical protein [Sphingomonas sp. AX6]